MEQNIDLRPLILGSNRNNLERWTKEGQDPSFYKQFSEQMARFIVFSSPNLLTTQQQEITEREGRFGVLPPPAKRGVVKAILTGESIVPLRVYEEEKTSKPEISVDTVYLHVILPVDPMHTVSTVEQKMAVDTLLCVGNSIALTNSSIKGETQSGTSVVVKIEKIRGILYLIKRGVVGDFSFEKIPLSSASNIETALSAYKESQSSILGFNPSGIPSRDYFGYEIINSRLEKDIEENKEKKSISLPIVLSLTNHSYQKRPLLSISQLNGIPNITLLTAEQ